MDDLTRYKQHLAEICEARFSDIPQDIKNRFLSYINNSVTHNNRINVKEMLEGVSLTESSILNFDKDLIDIISRSVSIDKMLDEVNSMPNNWLIKQARQKNISYQKDTESIILVEAVPLILGKGSERLFNSPVYKRTKEYNLYPAITSWLDSFAAEHHYKIARVAIVKLKVGGTVGEHMDYGDYHKTRDRYHLCLDGEYLYSVLDRSEIITKGTLFKFNNKCVHSAVNTGTVPRICVIFDTEKLS